MRLFIPLILAFYANASFALSFGDATLKSYLGESLIVKLNVTDVEKSPDSNCFTITDTNETSAFRKAFSTLTPYKDGYQLTITTQSVITEPILGLRVSYHCEPQLDRDYVLLLDPAPHHGEALGNTNHATQSDELGRQPSDSIDKPSLASQPNNIANVGLADKATGKTLSKAKRKSKKRPTSLSNNTDTSSADDKLMDAYIGKQTSATKQTTSSTATDKTAEQTPIQPSSSSKPYLSISGGSATSNALNGQANLGLKFETQIDLNRAPPIAPIDNAEMMDEVTVMSNRLSHLEKQIISLQAQNIQLRNEAALAKNELESQKSGWFDYLLLVIGVGLLIVALEWLRRTWAARRSMKQEMNWLNAEDTEASDDDEQSLSATSTLPSYDSKQAKNDSFSPSFLDDQSYDDEKIEPSRPTTLSVTEHVSDEHDSIIDNADVFIEHERPLLAIQLLQNHLNDFPRESPKVWLKLLSLIASEGTEAEYEAAVIEAKKHFNIRVPHYFDAKNEDLSSIEDYSNIVARLEGVWGSPFAVKFLNDLIYDQHAQPAEGFSANNFEELFFLKKIAELLSTGVSTSQRTLYRTATATLASGVESTPTTTNLDNLAFNEAAFGEDISFDQASPSEMTEKPSNNAISDEDFTVASLLDTPEQAKLNKPTKEESYSQFENSPFQKVPSYDVDMLVDFDDHIENTEPIVEASMPHDVADTVIAEDIKQAFLEKDDDSHEVAEEFHFPLNVYPEEAAAEDISSTETNEKPTPNKSKDSNIIEWDLPKLGS